MLYFSLLQTQTQSVIFQIEKPINASSKYQLLALRDIYSCISYLVIFGHGAATSAPGFRLGS